MHDCIIDLGLLPDSISAVLSDRNPRGAKAGQRAKGRIC